MSRNYSSTAVDTTLTSGVSGANTSLVVGSTTGFPAVPFILAVDVGTALQELVLVTAVGGLTLTVTRGYDSTVAVAHESGAVISHSHAAIDFREAGVHIDATAAHGTTGAVVGTSDTQTLTNKTITDPVINESSRRLGHWQAYVPTLTNFGATVNWARYTTIGKTVHVQFKGTITAVPTGTMLVSMPLPFPVGIPSGQSGPLGVCSSHDVGSTMIPGVCQVGTGSTVQFASADIANTYWQTNIPFTWAVGDEIGFSVTYETA